MMAPTNVAEFRQDLWAIINSSESKDEALYTLKQVSAIPTMFHKQREAAIQWTEVHWEQIFGGSL